MYYSLSAEFEEGETYSHEQIMTSVKSVIKRTTNSILMPFLFLSFFPDYFFDSNKAC